jgi:hypothetical protein
VLEPIPSHCVSKVWGSVAPILQRAIDKSQKDFLAEDILQRLLDQHMQLWVWIENGEIVACCITQIANYPQRKVCQLPFIAGKAMRHWLSCEPIFIQWAKANGCNQLEGFCRDGWLRVLNPMSWFKVWTTMRKDI